MTIPEIQPIHPIKKPLEAFETLNDLLIKAGYSSMRKISPNNRATVTRIAETLLNHKIIIITQLDPIKDEPLLGKLDKVTEFIERFIPQRRSFLPNGSHLRSSGPHPVPDDELTKAFERLPTRQGDSPLSPILRTDSPPWEFSTSFPQGWPYLMPPNSD